MLDKLPFIIFILFMVVTIVMFLILVRFSFRTYKLNKKLKEERSNASRENSSTYRKKKR